MKKSCFVLHSEQDTQKLARWLAKQPLTGSLWLSGDLGAGKTTFVRYFLQALGHKGAVKSPTYTLVEPYQINGECIKSVYHADLYRLQDSQELDFIGFFEYFDEKNSLVIIEWASQAKDVLPAPDVTIELSRLANDDRQVCVTVMNAALVFDEFEWVTS